MKKERKRQLIIEPPIFAHRGASFYAPENTMAAFLKAKQLGFKWLEFDVMLSADHQVVVIHDETLDRTTNGAGNVSDYTYSELKQLDAGSWFHPDFSGERIPLFRDVIVFLQNQQMAANVEIKALPGSEEHTVKKVAEEIQQYWLDSMMPPLISSFSLKVMSAVKQLQSEYWLGLLMHEWNPDWQEISEDLDCVSIHLNEKIVDQHKIACIKSTERLVFCYTVNEQPRAQTLFSWGVDALYSDGLIDGCD